MAQYRAGFSLFSHYLLFFDIHVRQPAYCGLAGPNTWTGFPLVKKKKKRENKDNNEIMPFILDGIGELKMPIEI